MNAITLGIGPEQVIMDGGLQPFMFKTANGRLVVQAQLQSLPGTAFPGTWGTVCSDDGGRAWQACRLPGMECGSPFFEGCAVTLRDGATLFLEWSARGPQPGGEWIGRLWETRDNWQTLGGPMEARIHLPAAKVGYDDGGAPVPEVFLHRTLMELPNGDLLLTAYGWFEGDDTPSTYVPTMNKFRSLLLRSEDRGRHWSLVSTMAVDPTVGEEGFNEPVLTRLRHGPHAGRLIALMRTGHDRTIMHCRIHQVTSDDEGRTWTEPRALDFENVDPDILEMSNGILVAAYGWRTYESRPTEGGEQWQLRKGHGNYLVFSLDSGETWVQGTQLTREPSTCYTAMVEVEPGVLLLTYDIGGFWSFSWRDYPDIRRGIGCRRIEVT